MSADADEAQPAKKQLIRVARNLPKRSHVWIQGVLVWKSENQIAVDDGTGIARVDVCNQEKRDLASCVHTLDEGSYIMVVGETAGKFKGHRLGIRAMTVRDLTAQGVMMESLWNLETVDAFLHEHETLVSRR